MHALTENIETLSLSHCSRTSEQVKRFQYHIYFYGACVSPLACVVLKFVKNIIKCRDVYFDYRVDIDLINLL